MVQVSSSDREEFFSVNAIEKDSGLINLSFSAADPERYADCGVLDYEVSNARGKRFYRIPIASKNARYERVEGGTLQVVERQISLYGKINVVVASIDPRKSELTVNAKYTISIVSAITGGLDGNYRPITQNLTASADFDSRNSGKFADATCFLTGLLEKEILDMVAR